MIRLLRCRGSSRYLVQGRILDDLRCVHRHVLHAKLEHDMTAFREVMLDYFLIEHDPVLLALCTMRIDLATSRKPTSSSINDRPK